ncbi:MAG: polyhydroxyalkanoate synthesis repressor PhaR [Alphaproteobacteria bacterium]|jgi:polyhydroxyalkanoate synthesis repressor PhaR|nr:polyhydroxyalkanoate synthesis repressor PhaR [Alphaproteobacteria bacterium]
MSAKKGSDKPTVIKKYANRRLYDTGRSSYVTLDDLCQMIKEGYDFVVYDAKSGEDLTRGVLTQIIVEQEAKSGNNNLLPTNFLRQLIGFYGDNMSPLVPNYLEQTFGAFTKNQDQMRDQMNKSFGGIFPVSSFEELSKQNMVMLENAMKAFGNFGLKNKKSEE